MTPEGFSTADENLSKSIIQGVASQPPWEREFTIT